MAVESESGLSGCGVPGGSQHSYVASMNSSWVVYGCLEGYRHLAGHLMRQCRNATWTGQVPTCTVDSILPKAYLVLLIIGATLSVFVACIPFDFYRFRRRKKAARKHQERLSLMTRIAPGHAKMMTETLPVDGALPAAQRRFGFRSLIKAFRYGRTLRFMAEKMKTTNEDDADAGTSSTGTGEGTTTSTTATTTTTSTTTAANNNNGGLVSGTGGGGGGVPPLPPSSPNPTENVAARARMSAVLQLWSGRGGLASRAKSLDFGDDQQHPLTRPSLLTRQKRNSLVSAANNGGGSGSSSSAIQAAATTAATAAAAATASCGGSFYDDEEEEETLGKTSASASNNDNDEDDAANDAAKDRQQLAPSGSVDRPLLEPVSPVSMRLPHVGSARYVQLAASIPEDADETEDGACAGVKFKVTDRKKVTSSNSLPSSWPEAQTSSLSSSSLPHAVPATPGKPGAFSREDRAASSSSQCRVAGRGASSRGRRSLETASAGLSCDSLLAVLPPTARQPLQRQLSQDVDRQCDRREAALASLAAEESEASLQGPIVADIH